MFLIRHAASPGAAERSVRLAVPARWPRRRALITPFEPGRNPDPGFGFLRMVWLCPAEPVSGVFGDSRRLFVDSELRQNRARTSARPPFMWERSKVHVTEETFPLCTNVTAGLLNNNPEFQTCSVVFFIGVLVEMGISGGSGRESRR